MDKEFKAFRDGIIESLIEYQVAYKLFGGAVVCLVDDDRKTQDIDVAIQNSFDNTENLIDALVNCGFGDRDNISMQIYGEGFDPDGVLYSTVYLEPTNPDWKEFHIDLCFDIGQHNYDTMPSEIFDDGGLKINIVTFRHIIRMKANIVPKPRDKDVKDIEILSRYLGLDPLTGEPKKDNTERKPKFMNLFGGKNK